MKKRALSAILSLALVCTGLPVSVAAAAPVEIDISKGAVSMTADMITYYAGETPEQVTVTESFPAAGYKIIGAQAPENTLTIQNVQVPVVIAASVNASGAVQSASALTVAAGGLLDAQSIAATALTVDGTAQTGAVTAGVIDIFGALTATGAVATTGGGAITVQNGGTLTANQTVNAAGDLLILGTASTGAATASGTLTVAGTLNASGAVSAQSIAVENGGRLDAARQTVKGVAGIEVKGNGILKAEEIRNTANMTAGGTAEISSAAAVSDNLWVAGKMTAGSVNASSVGVDASGELSAAVITANSLTTAGKTSATGAVSVSSSAEVTGSGRLDADYVNAASLFGADGMTAKNLFTIGADLRKVALSALGVSGGAADVLVSGIGSKLVPAAANYIWLPAGEQTVSVTAGGETKQYKVDASGNVTLIPTHDDQGTAGNPIRITTPAQFAQLNGAAAGTYFRLDSNLTISTQVPSFGGILDGNGKTIALQLSGASGLFGTLGESAQVNNLTLTGTVGASGVPQAGALAQVNNGVVSNVRSTAQVSAADAAGGLVGDNWGSIVSGNVSGTVSAKSAGGIAGVSRGSIDNSSTSGTITAAGAASAAGGIAGTVTAGSIVGSSSNATVKAPDGLAGGIAGNNHAAIKQSKFTGTVSGASAGGIAGKNTSMHSIVQSWSSGAITGANYAGGVAAENTGSISGSYATGAVKATSGAAGGVAGTNTGSISGSYATGAVAGTSLAGGIAGTTSGTISQSFSTSAVTASAGKAGGIAGTVTSGSVSNSMALNSAVRGTTAANRVTGDLAGGTLSNNHAAQSMSVTPASTSSTQVQSGNGGASLTNSQLASASTFSNVLGSGTFAYKNGALPGAGSTQALPTHLRVSTGGGGGGGGGDYEPPYSETYWQDVEDRVRKAKSGDTIKISTSKLDNMPTWVLKLIKGKNITYEISYGREKITINGKRMHDIPKNRVFYNWDALAKLYKKQPASSSRPASSSSAASSRAPVVTTPVYPTNPTYPTSPGTVTTPSSSSSSSEASSVSEPEPEELDEERLAEESEPDELETDAEPEKNRRSIVPLVVAGVVVLLALGAAGAVYYVYRRRRLDEEDFYDFGDE